MVQMEDLMKIRRKWKASGELPCEHTRTEKEYDRGTQTGDVGCLDCGGTWWYAEFERMREAGKADG